MSHIYKVWIIVLLYLVSLKFTIIVVRIDIVSTKSNYRQNVHTNTFIIVFNDFGNFLGILLFHYCHNHKVDFALFRAINEDLLCSFLHSLIYLTIFNYQNIHNIIVGIWNVTFWFKFYTVNFWSRNTILYQTGLEPGKPERVIFELIEKP